MKLSRELIQLLHIQYNDNEIVNAAECVNAALLSIILTTVKGSQFSTFCSRLFLHPIPAFIKRSLLIIISRKNESIAEANYYKS